MELKPKAIPGYRNYSIDINGNLYKDGVMVRACTDLRDKVELKESHLTEKYHIFEIMSNVWYLGDSFRTLRQTFNLMLPVRMRDGKADRVRNIRREWMRTPNKKAVGQICKCSASFVSRVVNRQLWDEV